MRRLRNKLRQLRIKEAALRKSQLLAKEVTFSIAEMIQHLLENGYMIGKDGKIVSPMDSGYIVSTVGGDEILYATAVEAVKQIGQVV